MSNQLNRIVVTLDRNRYLGTTLRIKVERAGENDVCVQRIVPDNDFISYWDYVWDACKRLLDEELMSLAEKL